MASSRFLAALVEQAQTHIGKSAGYAGKDNPDTWANFRQSTKIGVTPLQGCMVRLSDKFERACNLMRDAANDQVGESLRDTLVDLGNYAMIAVCLLDEQRLGPEQPVWPSAEWVAGLRQMVWQIGQGATVTVEEAQRNGASIHCNACGEDLTVPYEDHIRTTQHLRLVGQG